MSAPGPGDDGPQAPPQGDAEAHLIARILRHTAGVGPRAQVGPGDDAAVTALGDTVTIDALIEGVHFNDRLSAADVGYKALAASVSDLAAMGARPRWAVLAISLPRADTTWVDGLAQGLAEACRAWKVALIGGDTTGSPGPRMVTITAGGELVGAPLRRRDARVGDQVWITGTPGLAGAGWRMADPPPEALVALRRPAPPLALALALARSRLVHAAMDLSDGLASDLPRLCRASGLGAVIDPDRVPLAAGLPDALDHALRGGEDYQLLFTAAPHHADTIRRLAAACTIRCTAIGDITSGNEIVLKGMEWPNVAFDHFVPGTI